MVSRPWRSSAVAQGICACCAFALLFGAAMSRAEASNELTEDIPPQLLPEALAAFARQTGLQVIYVSEIARGHASKGSPAGLTASAALTRLLDGTGLRFEFLTARGVRIVAAAGPSRPASEHAARPLRHDQGSAGTLATLEEVVVSAAQRDERLSRVPLSIAVWTQQAVQASGARDIAAIANLTPGVEFEAYPDYGPGIETNIAIRGVNAKDGSTTAVYIDDTPIPHDRASVWGRAYPVLFDLERIEVLRGPQGVLMGEGAEGGAVRFITTQPSLTTWSGFARSEAATTTRGAPSYEYGAAAGGPVISEVAGFRVGVWLRRDGGYVNRVDPFTGATVDPNANWARTEVLRAAITIAPTAAIQITPLINYQSIHVDDSSAFYTYLSDPSRGLLHNGKLLEQWDNDRTCLATLRISVALGAAIDLSATSAYFRRQAFALQDQTNISGWNWPNPMGGEYPVSYADAKPDGEPFEQHTVSQQVRLSSSDPAARLRWLAGIGYVHAHDRADQDIVTTALADGGSVSGNTRPDRMTIQVAAYGQVDWRLQERLTATAGLRVERASYNSVVVLRDTPDPAVFQVFQVTGHATPTAPRLALSFQPDASNLYYASVAKGYRMGGPNVQVGFYCGVTTPPAYGPDAVWTYELGAKKELLGSRLQINSSLFHTRWRDVQTQIPVPDCGIAYTTNAGAATSNGFDLAGQALLTDYLKVGLTVAYADAHYTETVMSAGQVVVRDGDAVGALPLVSPPWSVTASGDYQLKFASDVLATLHAQDVFHSRNPGPFTSENPAAIAYAPLRRPNPSTNQLNLSAMASWSNVELSVFVNNVLDSQPTLQRRNYLARDTLTYATTVRPRTVGVSANWRL